MKGLLFTLAVLVSATANAKSDHWWREACMGLINQGRPLPAECCNYVACNHVSPIISLLNLEVTEVK